MFGDRPAGCALEVTKKMTVEAGSSVDPVVAEKLRQGSYVDDASCGGSKEDVDKLIGTVTKEGDKFVYDGSISQIFELGGFKIKVMVRDGESDPDVISMLGGGVLGLPWEPTSDTIQFHFGLNMSQKRQGVRSGPELTDQSLHIIDETVISKRLVVSAINSI